MNKVIVFGNGSYAKTLSYYIETYTDWAIEGYSTDTDFQADFFNEKKYISFENMIKNYSPKEYRVVMGIGYSNMNMLREAKFNMLKSHGYSFPNFIHPSAILNNCEIGEGNIILENVIMEPNTIIGDDNIVWSSVLLGHNGIHGNHNHYAACSLIAGNCIVGNNCFFGNHATVKDGIKVADYTLLGAGSYLSKNTVEYDVFVPARSEKINRKSTFFI